MRATIDYGIDLGTTNSAIARQEGLTTEVLSGHDGLLVPSVVHIGADGVTQVGKAALERRFSDPTNTAIEFKRLMGTESLIFFQASACQLSPVELSAELLKHLLERARGREGDVVEAAVITVPAMFQLPQCEATKRAAELSGLKYAPLLQEPIAAAIASVGSAELREGYWLIYDLGGGTFDVSLVRSRGGRLQVLDHDGDNHLGGKDFDRILARRAAEIVRGGPGGEVFRRTDTALAPAFERLRAEAERVRMALSDKEQEEFNVEQLAKDGAGNWLNIRFSLDRSELETLISPTISRTVALCQQMLSRNRLSAAEIKRLVLVGGPTLTPCLPRIIEADLGIESRHYVDPSQAVVIGAALYASTRRVPKEIRRHAAQPGSLELELSYEPMTNDTKPLVAGKLIGERDSGTWQVRFSTASDGFVSAPITLLADGTFISQLQLLPGELNVFEVGVYRDGTQMPVEGSRFSIIHGTTVAKPLLSQSVGVVLADNSVRWYLRRGRVLPASEPVSHATTISLRRGQSGVAVHVPLIQGESEKGDRNTVVGVLQIRAEDLARDLPVGSEVVITLTVDEHSTTAAEAYVPLLDQTFREVVKFGIETRKPVEIQQGVEDQRARLAELQKMAEQLEDTPETDVDDRVRLIEELLEEGGADEINQADQMLQKVTGLIDSLETKDKEGSLAQQFEVTVGSVNELLDNKDVERARQLKALSEEFQNAVERADLRLAEAKLTMARELEWELFKETPGFWVSLFDSLSEAVLKTEKAAEGRVAIDHGNAARSRGDLNTLIQSCVQLSRLIPREQKPAILHEIESHIS
ncbi:MAG TPA: Hsp70 family protein [Blastocatellia bacterium]|jgi:molecular chaperone DnaK|nr:Hsp70 family protein [Blastocatellia bacterium]